MAYPSAGLAVFGIATDWIDGPIARRGGVASYGARYDLEADSGRAASFDALMGARLAADAPAVAGAYP